MSNKTNVGYLLTQPEDSIQELKTLFENVFGITVNLLESTIIGQLIEELSKILIQLENDKTFIYSDLYNVNTATGKWLDGLLKFDSISRLPATYSTIIAQLSGLPNITIPAGSKAITNNNDIFILQNDVILDQIGNGVGNFKAENSGAIPVNANTLTKIVQTVYGWATVNNATNGNIGTSIETDYHLRYTQKYKLSINSSGGVSSLISNFAIQSYISYFNVYNNNTKFNYIDTITGIIVPAYSIYVALVFNDLVDHKQQIGKIFYDKLTAGTPTSGEQNIIYVPPQYQYSPEEYFYDLGEPVNIYINVIISINGIYPGNLDFVIKNGIIDIFNGESDQEPILMGSLIYARRFEKILLDLGIYNILSLTIGKSLSTQSNSLQLGINQYPVININNIRIERQ